jgi:hypothetical protein
MLCYGLDIMEQLIIKALKAACGNKNIKFQVIVQDEQLHIYVNHKQDHQLNYSLLTENVSAAIASLALDKINSFWLYGRPLGQVEPNWQVFGELPSHDQDEIEDTTGNTDNLEHLESELDFEDLGNFDLATSGTTADAGLLEQDVSQKTQVTDVVSLAEANSNGDTGLLQNQGLIHGCPLKEAEINTFSDYLNHTTEAANLTANNNLAQYCFISDQELLTEKKVAPSKKVMRLVKFFHYLANSDQQQLLPILERYFQASVIDEGQEKETSPTIQNWLEQIGALEDEERSIFALWFSCYCFNPTVTLAEFKTISAQNSPQIKIKPANRATESSFVPVDDNSPPSLIINLDQNIKLDQTKSQLPPIVKQLIKQLILPGIWILATIILILLGIINHNSQIVITSAQIPALCRNTIGSPEYCRLAVDLAGEKAIAQAPKSLFPLTKVTEAVATYGCARYANLKADVRQIAPEVTPVISSHGEKIFPHIYVVQAQQKNAKQLGNIRVGCVYTTGNNQRSPRKIATDLIPLNWPIEQYQKQTGQGNYLSLGIFTQPINLGLFTIFAALGTAIASRLNLGLKIQHTHTIYLVALILGVVQLIIALLPSFGLLGAIFMPISTILLASLLLEDFQLNWKRGYPSIAISILAIVAIQFLLSSLCLELINSLA